MIVNTFSNEVEIDKNVMSKELDKFNEKKVDNLLLSEIILQLMTK